MRFFTFFLKASALCFGLVTLSLTAKAQRFFIGNKSYQATPTIHLKGNGSSVRGLDCIIAKKEVGGIIALTASYVNGVCIKGKSLIYLENGGVITLIDRKLYDNKDGESTTVYYLTDNEMQMLATNNINTIRYSLKCFECSWSTEEGNFSASNKDDYTQSLLRGYSDVADTAAMIGRLIE